LIFCWAQLNFAQQKKPRSAAVNEGGEFGQYAQAVKAEGDNAPLKTVFDFSMTALCQRSAATKKKRL
jgi:hypothetical protein